MDPWGIPQEIGADESPWIQRQLSDKQNLNYNQTEALRPTTCSNLYNKMLWSTASKAADKSKRMNTTKQPESTFKRRTFKVLSRHLWQDLNPDWTSSQKLSFYKGLKLIKIRLSHKHCMNFTETLKVIIRCTTDAKWPPQPTDKKRIKHAIAVSFTDIDQKLGVCFKRVLNTLSADTLNNLANFVCVYCF